MFSLGIGSGVNETQLTDIASSAKNVFTAPTFADLTPAADTIVENSCTGKLGLNVKNKNKTRENTKLFSKVIRDQSETGRTDVKNEKRCGQLNSSISKTSETDPSGACSPLVETELVQVLILKGVIVVAVFPGT